ncbi:hypothetical protein H0H92_004959 [Tricholoma furcatifolium]|nr:hypothetical protein H0H92_004959 [Tricholoma furcatifolium]
MLDRLMAHNDQIPLSPLYAKVGGISVTELNVLEREFLSAIDWRLTCTRDLLQDYYVNLVRTNNSGKFTIVGLESPTPSDSDAEMESMSRPPSPSDSGTRGRPRRNTSTILVEPAVIAQDATRRPTVEQNMAFAALRESQGS